GAGDSNQQGPNTRYARGYGRFHTPHRLTINGSYLLPFFAGRRDATGLVLGGWQISGVLRLASGTPFTVTQPGVDLNFDGFSESRPVILDRSILGNSVDHPDRSQQQLPASAFRRAAIGDEFEALVGRNTFFADGLNVLDLGIYKTFRMPTRGHLLSLRFEMYNAFNTVQYGFPTTDITSSFFGRIAGVATVYNSRVMQIAVRYRY
ncbi:MAG: hypothetical protein HY654_03130, partial [Acidobacteria bacterium]|nr:hypothetical protein [Acidobacteriota bacterium]